MTLDTPERKQWILITWPSMVSEVGTLIIAIGGLIHFLTSHYKKRLNRRMDRIGISLFLIGYSFDVIRTLYAYFLEEAGTDVFDLGIRWGGIIQPMFYTGLIIILRKENPKIISILIIIGSIALFIRNTPYALLLPHTSLIKCISFTAWFVIVFFIHIVFTLGIIISMASDRMRKNREIAFY